MKLGARMIKTGLAITLSIYLAMVFGLEPASFAAISATFAIQPSIYKSYQSIVENIQGNVIGAFFAVLFFITLGNEPFVIGIVVIIAIAVNLKLNIEKTIPLTVVTVIIIMGGTPTEGFITFAFERFTLILIGVLSSFVINLVFMPPKFETKLFYKILHHTEEIIQSISLVTRHESDPVKLKEDIVNFRETRMKTEQLYLLYKEERTYLQKNRYAKRRKLVVFRQMLQTSQKALDLLKNLRENENEFQQAPEDLQKAIREHLDCLLHYHQRVMLKFSGRIRSDVSTESVDEACDGTQSLAEAYMSFYKRENEIYQQWLHLFPIIALIVDYKTQLDHLDKLVQHFQTFHQKENQLSLKESE